ncbi:MAG: methyltransferase domain-containing protein [Desulfosudaceae bacterium]
MSSWREIEATADENGFIPEQTYTSQAERFPICPAPDPQRLRQEKETWRIYLSSRRRRKKTQVYNELFRYEWIEGRKRKGFWQNIEKALKLAATGATPVITIPSAGTGRDLIKVGLASGIFESTAPPRIRGTCREIAVDYMRLAKPGARIMLTEYDQNSLASLQDTVAALIAKGALTREMVAIRKWDFRQVAPLAADSQDIIVFSLVGNYATIEEQPLILRELARCVKPGGYLIASTMTDKISFNTTNTLKGKLKLALTTPLAIPVAIDFIPWQIRWGKMAAEMHNKGYWKNVPASVWMDFLRPAGMEEVAIYPGPSKFLPVEVLVARKLPTS